MKYWKKVKGEATKNHRINSEDLRNGSFMLYEENDFGYNPGKYFEMFQTKLDSDAKYLFSQPIQPYKKNGFKLHQNPSKWYNTNKIGANSVAKAMPMISEAAGLSKITNHQLRASSINALIDAGVQDREVCSVSGHKAQTSISNYAKVPSKKRQIEMSRAISNGGRVSRQRLDQDPSTSTENVGKKSKTNDPSKIKNRKNVNVETHEAHETKAEFASKLKIHKELKKKPLKILF